MANDTVPKDILDKLNSGVSVSANYGGASGQTEVSIYRAPSSINGWVVAYTVPADTNFFLSGIVMGNDTTGIGKIGTGESGSETIVFAVRVPGNDHFGIALNIPIKFTANTKISILNTATVTAEFSLIGWTEAA